MSRANRVNDEEREPPGTAKVPPTLGEGCVRRYDPEALTDEDGTEFEGAEELWKQEKPR